MSRENIPLTVRPLGGAQREMRFSQGTVRRRRDMPGALPFMAITRGTPVLYPYRRKVPKGADPLRVAESNADLRRREQRQLSAASNVVRRNIALGNLIPRHRFLDARRMARNVLALRHIPPARPTAPSSVSGDLLHNIMSFLPTREPPPRDEFFEFNKWQNVHGGR